MEFSYCPQCGSPIGPGMNFCPKCGNSIKRSSVVQSNPPSSPTPSVISKSGGYFALALVADLITMLCLTILVYDACEQWWFHRMNGNQIFYTAGIMNSLYVSIFSSAAVGLIILASGIKKYSLFGNVVMVIGSFLTTVSIIYVYMFYGIPAWTVLFSVIHTGWLVLSILFVWTTIVRMSPPSKKTLGIILCLGLTAVIVFLYCLALKYK